MAFPSFTTTWHNDTYDAINPAKPSLSASGKTVVITGGGAGIGSATARSFARAGATKIAILGRREKILLETKASIEKEFQGVKVHTAVADVADKPAVDKAFASVESTFGKVHVFVNNAGYLADAETIRDVNLDEWLKTFEVNVKGSIVVTQAFLRSAASNATLINITTGGAHLAAGIPKMGVYIASKSATLKLFATVQAEEPDISVINVHPGVIETDMGNKGKSQGAKFPIDDIQLPADFIVWSASPEAAFLKGKDLWANWDVEELKARAQEIQDSSLLTVGLHGI
ncbi:MAG: hypothetical protein M1825_002885 [Sarcosagium campestre]|nr:MAG: hypothetical protein M1825_002885 [Sarcosagium campestre]